MNAPSSTQPRTPGYAFDNDRPQAVDQHACLSAILDGGTTARLSTLDLAGAHCLDLGAGGGSIALWLAEHVGERGRVVATDINPARIPSHPRLQVLRHNLETDPLHGPWNLIHERLVTVHLPTRRQILHRMAEALAPGGALLVEEWQTVYRRGGVLAAPTERAADLYRRYHDTLVEDILVPHGSDPTWAEQVHAAMLDEGLVVDSTVSARSWAGGTPGALLAASNIQQLRDKFLAAGWTPTDLDELAQALHDPRLVIRGNLCYSTLGRRP